MMYNGCPASFPVRLPLFAHFNLPTTIIPFSNPSLDFSHPPIQLFYH